MRKCKGKEDELPSLYELQQFLRQQANPNESVVLVRMNTEDLSSQNKNVFLSEVPGCSKDPDCNSSADTVFSLDLQSTITNFGDYSSDDDCADSNYHPDATDESSSEDERRSQNDYLELLPKRDCNMSNNHGTVTPSTKVPCGSIMYQVDNTINKTTIVKKNVHNFGIYKENGDVRKGNKKMDFCYFCEEEVLNFARHVLRHHQNEIDVMKISVLPPNSAERKTLLRNLRNKGNYLNSNVACKPVQKLKVFTDTLPCTNCLGFFSTKTLWRHRKKCLGTKSKNHKAEAQNLLIANLKVDLQLRNSVFPKMRADDISLTAKSDPLICAFGARYIKIHREKHFINVTSRKMRELARLLIEIRQRDNSIKSLFEALKPKYFDLIVEATKTVAKFNFETNRFESPSYALNMGTTLKQCADIAIILALKRKNVAATVTSAEAEADLKSLIQIIEAQWQFEISSQASSDLNIKKWNKVSIVPLAQDLKTLKEFLILKARTAIEKLQIENTDLVQYTILLETIYCRVLLLNRRRPGELQRLELKIYQDANKSSTSYDEFMEGKSLNEINFNLDEDLMENVDEEDSDEEKLPLRPISPVTNSIHKPEDAPKKSKKIVKTPWTNEQKQIVEQFFSNHIKAKKPPKKDEYDFYKAQQKLKVVEYKSDLTSDADDKDILFKRNRRRRARFSSSDEDSHVTPISQKRLPRINEECMYTAIFL
ncbi:hypothetical protein RN001_002425 [Aquatica leii]|uniref:Uncharacterized protein n=1 Tax=Aquatica leii TaxID=1421715 RepID=A0AAN7SLU0_9COLE|nr:hypothetical protein RN001_002425 [Aquatica leii]